MKCKTNIGLPLPPKTIVASPNPILKKWSSHVSQRRHFLPKNIISFYLNQGNISIGYCHISARYLLISNVCKYLLLIQVEIFV